MKKVTDGCSGVCKVLNPTVTYVEQPVGVEDSDDEIDEKALFAGLDDIEHSSEDEEPELDSKKPVLKSRRRVMGWNTHKKFFIGRITMEDTHPKNHLENNHVFFYSGLRVGCYESFRQSKQKQIIIWHY